MIDPIGDLYQYLTGQIYVTDRLDIYAGSPAVFAQQIPPNHKVGLPVCVIDYPLVNQRLQTSSNINRDIQTSLRIYAQVSVPQAGATIHDTLPLQQASEAIAGALITAQIPVSGGVLRGAKVVGPIYAPTDNASLSGRLITVNWRVEEI